MPGVSAHLARFANVAADAPPEKKGLGDGVGAVERRYADREDDIESSCGAQVDDADETGNAAQNINGVARDCGLWVYLVERKSANRDRIYEA